MPRKVDPPWDRDCFAKVIEIKIPKGTTDKICHKLGLIDNDKRLAFNGKLSELVTIYNGWERQTRNMASTGEQNKALRTFKDELNFLQNNLSSIDQTAAFPLPRSRAKFSMDGSNVQKLMTIEQCFRELGSWAGRHHNSIVPERKKLNLKQNARQVAGRIQKMDHGAQYRIVRHLRVAGSLAPNERTISLGKLSSIASDMEAACESALAEPKQKGPKRSFDLQWAVRELLNLYESLTGRQATHTPYSRTEYTGLPQSEAGRFVVDCMAEIDQSVAKTKISNVMADLIRHRNKN